MTFRNLARAGTTSLLAAGTLAFAAAPALAADVDFGINLTGTTIAADATGKLGFVTVTNEGTTTPTEVEVLFDTSDLDTSKVELLGVDECAVENQVADCALTPSPGPGESAELPIPLIKQDGATGDAGSLTVTVKVAGDTNPANDSKTVDVAVGGNGVDLTVVTPDVYLLTTDENAIGTKPIPPGGQGLLLGFIANQGDAVADGLTVKITLPKDVTLGEDIEGCAIATDKQSADCTYQDLSLLPLDADPSGDKSTTGFGAVVTVSPDAAGPVALRGGEMSVAAIDQEVASAETLQSLARKAAPVPKNFRQLTADQLKAVEVDATDNTDTFAVLVAAAPGGSGGGTGGGTGGGEGDNGGLPVTGPVAASVAGVGGAVLVAGAVLLFLARRRPVVVVTPSEDE